MTSDDSQLMQRVQQGELHLFDVLVQRYRQPLLRVAAGMLGDAAWAEDVVQETFLAVYAARQTFNPAFRFRTWLWTILLNLCRRQRGKQARRARELVQSAGDQDVVAERRQRAQPGTGLSRLLERERDAQLHALLDELPDFQADAIRLRFFAGLTYDEIARAMGVSLGGAKLRVRSGLTKLSQRLRADGETYDEL